MSFDWNFGEEYELEVKRIVKQVLSMYEKGLPLENIAEECNLTIGKVNFMIEKFEEGRTESRKEGRTEGIKDIALNMYKKGYPLDNIAEICNLTIEEVNNIIKDFEDLV